MAFSNDSKYLLLGNDQGKIIKIQTNSLHNYIALKGIMSSMPIKTQNPKLLKTRLPLDMTPLHFALYRNDFHLFKSIL